MTVGGPGLVAVGSGGSDAAVWVAATEGESGVEVGGDGVEVGDEGGEPLPLAPGSVARIDPATNELTAAIETDMERDGGYPFVVVGEGVLWAVNRWGSSTLTQIDPETNTVLRTAEIVGEATDIAISGGSVWVTSTLAGGGRPRSSLRRLRVVFRRAVGLAYSGLADVAVGAGAVCVAAAEANVALRIEPTTGAAVAAILLLGQPWDVAVGEGAVWLLGGGPQRSVIPVGDWDVGSGTVWRIDPGTNEVVATVELPGGVDGDARIATGAGGVWVTGGSVNTIFRIDPATNRISETIPVQSDAGAVAVGRGSLWVVSEGYGTVKRIDPATHEVIATIDIRGGCVCSVAVGAGGVWATS